ncbi:MAG: hybrid sensor histidine kinase/response regulator, partial [Planctomycetota bacterium]
LIYSHTSLQKARKMNPKDEILEIFRSESKDHLNQIYIFLEEWEKHTDQLPDMKEVLRRAHTLKGDARMVGLEEISEISHIMEDIFKALRDGLILDTSKALSCLWNLLFLLETWIFEYHPKLEEEWNILKKDIQSQLLGSTPTKKGLEKGKKTARLLGKLSAVIRSQEREDEVPPTSTSIPEEKQKKLLSLESTPKEEKDVSSKSTPEDKGEAQKTPPSKISPENKSSGEFLRIPSHSLDEILNLLGELTINREKITSLYYRMRNILLPFIQDIIPQLQEEEKKELKSLMENLYEELGEYYYLSTELQNNTLDIRMLPLSMLFQDYPRMVKKIAAELGKKVVFQIEGENTLLDKNLLEAIRPAITHLVRNSIDHGIETPEERREAGKDEAGKVVLKAYPKGNHVFIELEDDGKGIGEDLIRKKALEKNLLPPEKLATLDRQDLLNLIFTPGFSTKEKASQISGRGIGLDIVHHTIDRLKGHITVQTEPGQFTRFILQLPMTLTIMQALLVTVDGQIVALPLSFVQETQVVLPSQIQKEGGLNVFRLRGEYIPIFYLSTILGLQKKKSMQDKYLVAVLRFKKNRIGVIVDKFLREQEIVVKQLGDYLDDHPLLSGATILRKGDPAIILNIYDVFQYLFFQNLSEDTLDSTSVRKPRILVVDDSLTVRTVQKSVLENAGYEVETAASGQEGLEKIGEEHFDMVITDIQMEPMDGFEFTKALRQNPEYKDIPIIIVSSLAREEDRQKGLEAGANAYIVKSGYDQRELLKRVQIFLGEGQP